MVLAELDAIHPQGPGHVLHVALAGEHGLGNAVAPHGPCRRLVGKDAVGVPFHVGAGVQLGEGTHALGHYPVAMGSVGALVGEAFDLAGGKGAVRPDPADDMGADGMAHPVANEGFLPAHVQLYQPAAHHRGKVGAQGLI